MFSSFSYARNREMSLILAPMGWKPAVRERARSIGKFGCRGEAADKPCLIPNRQIRQVRSGARGRGGVLWLGNEVEIHFNASAERAGHGGGSLRARGPVGWREVEIGEAVPPEGARHDVSARLG